jgi:3,4-dihydroxy-2-butanone 4-phosphate synthase
VACTVYREARLRPRSILPCPCGRPFQLACLDDRSGDVLQRAERGNATVRLHRLALLSPLAPVAELRQ